MTNHEERKSPCSIWLLLRGLEEGSKEFRQENFIHSLEKSLWKLAFKITLMKSTKAVDSGEKL